jgi:hypothetical protein
MNATTFPTEIIPGLTLDYLLDGQIVAVSASNSSRHMIDAFVNLMVELQPSFVAEKPLYFLLDFSHDDTGFNTPYGRARMAEISKSQPAAVSYSAVVVRKTYVMNMAQFFLQKVNRKNNITRIFFSHEEALQWLQDTINKESKVA